MQEAAMTSKVRAITSIALAVVAAVIMVFGLIDPLEGGLALLVATALLIVVRLVSQVPLPKLTWIPLLTAIVLGVTTLALAIFASRPEAADGRVANPLGGGVLVLLWGYRLAVLVAIVGMVVYLVRLIRAVRSPLDAQTAPADRPGDRP
jgi:hypothetical protein